MGKRIKVLRKGGYSSLLIFFTAEDAKKSRKSRKATGKARYGTSSVLCGFMQGCQSLY